MIFELGYFKVGLEFSDMILTLLLKKTRNLFFFIFVLIRIQIQIRIKLVAVQPLFLFL
jgi:hypothetical protein